MQKLLTIEYCDDCPHFDNSYWGYEERCIKLNKKISRTGTVIAKRFPIPEECPLPNLVNNHLGQ